MFLDENEVAFLKRYFLGEELTEREHESAVLIADCYDSHIGQTGLFADVWVDVPEEEREKEFARMCEEDVEDIRQYLSLYPWIKIWRERCEAEEFARWDEEERLEAERDELISRAIDMDEEPPVFGQWANIARSRMRHESPEEWIEMVQQGTASAYLKKVQEETAETFRTMRDAGLTRRGTRSKTNWLENVSERYMIDMQIREILARSLAGVDRGELDGRT